jgi:rfaE bifunctional protein kinase chain/domain
MSKKLVSLLDEFSSKKILVIGDIMLDKYIWGNVSRISPEAPVQIVHVRDESYAPGGAANVANNIAELGGLVTICGVRGDDPAGSILLKELRKRSIVTDSIIVDASRPTVQKVRVLGHNQQLLRIDYERTDGMRQEVVKQITEALLEGIKDVDAVVVSDYAKGITDKSIVKSIFSIAKKHDKIVIVDPKPQNKEVYKNCDVILPNYVEARSMSGMDDQDEEAFELLGTTLMQEMNANMVITRGEKGMSIFNRDGTITHIPTKAQEVYDVTGAGDTVTAALALAMAAGASLEDAATIANHAAGVVVGKVGTSTATIGEVRASMNNG